MAKVYEKPDEYIPPPTTYVLELNETEACIIRQMIEYPSGKLSRDTRHSQKEHWYSGTFGLSSVSRGLGELGIPAKTWRGDADASKATPDVPCS